MIIIAYRNHNFLIGYCNGSQHYYYILNVAMDRIYLNKIICWINAWMNLFLLLLLQLYSKSVPE